MISIATAITILAAGMTYDDQSNFIACFNIPEALQTIGDHDSTMSDLNWEEIRADGKALVSATHLDTGLVHHVRIK